MVVMNIHETGFKDGKFSAKIDFLSDNAIPKADLPEEYECNGTTYIVDAGSSIVTIAGDVALKGESGWGDYL